MEPKVRLQGYGYNPFCSHSSRCLAVLVWQCFEGAFCAPKVRLKWYGFKGFPSHSSHRSEGLFPTVLRGQPKGRRKNKKYAKNRAPENQYDRKGGLSLRGVVVMTIPPRETFQQYRQFGGSAKGDAFLERWWRGLRLFEDHSIKLQGKGSKAALRRLHEWACTWAKLGLFGFLAFFFFPSF